MFRKKLSALCVLPVVLSACGSGGGSFGVESSSKPEAEASSAESTVSEPVVLTENAIGEQDGYSYELWKDKGDTTMALTGGGAFTCEWSNINNALFRTGRKLGSKKTYPEYGEITASYGVDYRPEGNSYLCIYGWSKAPLVEYYIVESWGSWRPPGANETVGTIEVDGNTYDVYKTVRENQPSIEGTKTFEQYWSVRREKPTDGKTEGTVSVSRHFEEWEKLGLSLGKLYEAALTVEGYQSSGKAEVYQNRLSFEKE